jgi:hypothetical protein
MVISVSVVMFIRIEDVKVQGATPWSIEVRGECIEKGLSVQAFH